ncbi:MAG TPA: hypothetical protein VH481_01115 [Nitrososphaeraceae archaeon]|jgi:hypothetical protein
MKWNVLTLGLMSLLIGVTIISISSIRVPDPLHSTSTVFNGKIRNESRAILSLSDVQKGKNISLSINPQNSLDLLNVRILNPKGTLIFDQNSSQQFFITIVAPISGNYSAVLTNINKKEMYTNSMFGSAILFDSNRNPKIEIQTILIGVIIMLIGIAACTYWVIFESFKRLKRRAGYKNLT